MQTSLNIAQLNYLDKAVGALLENQTTPPNNQVGMAGSLVSWAQRQGHVCLDLNHLDQQDFAGSFLPGDMNRLREALKSSPLVGGKNESTRPLILSEAGKLYFHRYWHYEQHLIHAIKGRLQTQASPEASSLKPSLAALGKDQRTAVQLASRSTLTLISGGPGTGKTTTVIHLLYHLLDNPSAKDLKIALAAPTGKAAQRLQDALTSGLNSLNLDEQTQDLIPREATTLHRLLGYKYKSSSFVHDREFPLDRDVVVVDEASMLDLLMFSKLLDALKPDTQLILLGDSHQLSSVEAGSIFGDLVACGLTNPNLGQHMVELTENFRFGKNSHLFMTCELIKRGKAEEALNTINRATGDISMRKLPAPTKLAIELEKNFAPFFRDIAQSNDPAFALKQLETICLLTPLRKGIYGVEGLNAAMETIVKKMNSPNANRHGRFFPGQPVLITENSYTQNLFNGDIGVVLADQEKPGELFAYFRDTTSDNIRRLPISALPAWESAFALTVHKSQGSEYQRVVFIIPPGETPLLSRELIYTAVSRSRSRVEIWGDELSFIKGVAQQTQRTSGILDFLAK